MPTKLLSNYEHSVEFAVIGQLTITHPWMLPQQAVELVRNVSSISSTHHVPLN